MPTSTPAPLAYASNNHKFAPLGQVHKIHNYEFADATARLAWTDPDATTLDRLAMDIGRIARQLDDASFWVIADVALGTPNIITWQALGGGSAPAALPEVMFLRLSGNTGYMDDGSAGLFVDFSGTVEKTSPDAGWDDVTQQIVFNSAGYYRVVITAGIQPFLSYYPMTDCHYGTAFTDWPSSYITSGSTTSGGFLPKLTWQDEFFVTATALDQLPVGMSFSNQVYPDNSIVNFMAIVTVQRVM